MTQTLLFRSRFSCLAILMGTLCVFAIGGQAQEKPAGREIRATQALEPQVSLEGRIQVSPNLIPSAPGALPVFRLSAQKPPEEFLRQTLRGLGVEANRAEPLSKLPQLAGKEPAGAEEFVGIQNRGHLGAYWSVKSGDVEVFPDLVNQKPEKFSGEAAPQFQRAAGLAKEIFSRGDILAKDATQFTIGEPLPLLGQTAERNPGGQGVSDSARLLT